MMRKVTKAGGRVWGVGCKGKKSLVGHPEESKEGSLKLHLKSDPTLKGPLLYAPHSAHIAIRFFLRDLAVCHP
jgi:hypothetical protein